jgi:flagellar L-ring protein FlgH
MKQLMMVGLAATMLAGCTASTRPQLSRVDSNLANPQPVVTPVAIPNPPAPAVGSLWVPGSKQFFKDSRAHRVGDIVTVVVSEEATATIEGKTDASRTHQQRAGVSVLPFVSGQLLTRGIDLTTDGLANTSSNRDFQGDASTDRKDSLQASVAAVVTQVLPNGLLVIQGQREVLVNYEKQILQLSGIVRPEDISAQNSVPSSKIAEARIAYAGKGMIDDSQTPQYGVKWVDKILPF